MSTTIKKHTTELRMIWTLNEFNWFKEKGTDNQGGFQYYNKAQAKDYIKNYDNLGLDNQAQKELKLIVFNGTMVPMFTIEKGFYGGQFTITLRELKGFASNATEEEISSFFDTLWVNMLNGGEFANVESGVIRFEKEIHNEYN